jgi:addiction module HigA family antidote
MDMKNPRHPGRLLADELIEPLGLSVTETAHILNLGRQAVSAVLNGRTAVSAETALRFEKAFGVDAGLLLRMQAQYSLAEVRKRAPRIKVRSYVPRAA